MVLFFIVLLGISITGLLSILLIKSWELRSGKVALRSVRPAAGALLSSAMLFVETKAPVLVRNKATQLAHRARVAAHRVVALIVLVVERLLERVLHGLRGATRAGDGAQASEFLREVAEHKRSLIKKSSRSKKRNAIYEE